jgi:hypothetical protein
MAKNSQTSNKTSQPGSERLYPRLSPKELAKDLEEVKEMYRNRELRPATSDGLAIVPITPAPKKQA